mmetsp:Transcript_17773/g.32695  ORF Transcript_17773/g.32695 Transcript_17773/m.32695 type:complete len:263 (+) Transcript_17773:565-1353(+)
MLKNRKLRWATDQTGEGLARRSWSSGPRKSRIRCSTRCRRRKLRADTLSCSAPTRKRGQKPQRRRARVRSLLLASRASKGVVRRAENSGRSTATSCGQATAIPSGTASLLSGLSWRPTSEERCPPICPVPLATCCASAGCLSRATSWKSLNSSAITVSNLHMWCLVSIPKAGRLVRLLQSFQVSRWRRQHSKRCRKRRSGADGLSSSGPIRKSGRKHSACATRWPSQIRAVSEVHLQALTMHMVVSWSLGKEGKAWTKKKSL